jgi:hypothetical protein
MDKSLERIKMKKGFARLLMATPLLDLTGTFFTFQPISYGKCEQGGSLLFSDSGGQKETIEVRRRRQGTSGGPQSGERADAPVRRRDDGTGSGGSEGGGGGGGGSPLPTGGPRLPIWLVIVLVIGYGIYSLIAQPQQDQNTNSSSSGQNNTPAGQEIAQPTSVEPAVVDQPTKAPVVRKTPAASTGTKGQTWTVMLYQDADDKILEQDIYTDMNEVERVGSTDRVNIVTQIDRYKGAFTGDGDWTTARRYYIQKDDNLQKINSKLIADLGEVNMADGKTLVDFATWAIQAYPADKYVLILSDHGMGWPGGWSDSDPVTKDQSRAPIVSALDDNLYLMELDQSLGEIRSKAGVDKFELIGMDACLMGHLEVFSALEPHARYAVASQETEPALGWAYTGFLQELVNNPDMDGAALSTSIVNSYISDDQRIVDDQARADFLRQGSPMGGLYKPSQISARQLAQELGRDITLTAANLDAIPGLDQSVNKLAVALQDEDQSKIASARDYAQSFTNIFGKDTHAPYIDLGSFIQLLKKEGVGSNTSQAADQVLADIQQVVIAEKHGPNKPGAEGVSIYFPNSTLYQSPIAGPQSYTALTKRFSQESLWDDFLAYHYNDIPIDQAAKKAVVPGSGTKTRAPGAGSIDVSPVVLSSKVASPGKPITMSTDIQGKNIGYIYLFVGYYDKAANSINVTDTDYLESPDTQEANGIFYPKWKENQPFTMKLSWDPTVFAIKDGKNTVVALFNPEQYGASAKDAEYTVDGTYTYKDSGDQRRARLYFRDGQLRQVFGFTNTGDTGAPREITPQTGDTFTIQEKWLDLDASGQVKQTATQDGRTLTFGSQMFQMAEVYAAAGDYIVGFVVEDLDGNRQEVYTPVTVQ